MRHKSQKWLRYCAVIVGFWGANVLHAQPTIDYRYAPSQYLTLISHPDDWQKTLVDETGALSYDFGPGPYARPLTTIRFQWEGLASKPKQYLADPKVPIVTSRYTLESDSLNILSFALTPRSHYQPDPLKQLTEQVIRVGGMNGSWAWVPADADVEPAFQNVAWGTNRPIMYRALVDTGSTKRVALGFAEPYKPGPKTRLFDLVIEGAETVTFDPMAHGVKNKPSVVIIDGKDVDRDGKIRIEIHASEHSPDPNVFLNVFWVFPEQTPVDEAALIRGELNSRADIFYDCTNDFEVASLGIRADIMRLSAPSAPKELQLAVNTHRQLEFDEFSGSVRFNREPFIVTSPPLASAEKTPTGWIFRFPEGTRQADVMALHAMAFSEPTISMPDVDLAIQNAVRYWHDHPILPEHTITVPDPALQYLLETSIRNIYQVRDIIDGYYQFQPGPTVYRGLWVSSLVLCGTGSLAAGDVDAIREYLEAALATQDKDGRVRGIYPHLLMVETPIFASAASIYIRSTADREWADEVWDSFVEAINWIWKMRMSTMTDPQSENYGLMPVAFVDGGIAVPTADYGTAFWAATALEHGSKLAHWMGKNEEASRWENWRKELALSIEKAIQRDLQNDESGMPFLPVGVGQKNPRLPQQGQFGLLWTSRIGGLFDGEFPSIAQAQRFNLEMMARNSAEGLPVSAGWMEHAVWSWLSGTFASAQLKYVDRDAALSTLYAMANHAAPTGVWVEEQLVKEKGDRTSGDVSNGETSGAFITIIRDLIAVERGDELHLLKGVPSYWYEAGIRVALDESYTEFGPVTLEAQVSENGDRMMLKIEAIDGRKRSGNAVIWFDAIKSAGFVWNRDEPMPDQLALAWGESLEIQFNRKP